MRKKSPTVTSITDETHSKMDDPNDCDEIHSPNDSDSRYTIPSPAPPLISPENDTNAPNQIADITSAMSSSELQTEKVSSPPLSSTNNGAHVDGEESINEMDTFLDSEDMTLVPPPTDDITMDQAANSPTKSTYVEQSTSNTQTPEASAVTSPPPAEDDSNMDPATTPLSAPTDAVSGEPNNSTTTTATTATTTTTTTNVEAAPPGGGKTKRNKRQKYQTPTSEQLEILVNGHLNDKLSISAAARRAGIARSTASALMKKHKVQGSIPNRQPRGRTAPAKIQIEQAEWIDQYLSDHEEATLEMIRVALLMAFPNIKQISLSGLQRNITLKCSRHLKRRRQNKRTEQDES